MKTLQQEKPPVPDSEFADTSDRRNRTRIESQGTLEVHFRSAGQVPQNAVVEDLSFAGIALRVADVAGLARGQELEIVMLGQSLAVVIKYIAKAPQGGYRLGAEFTDPDLQQVTAVVEEFLKA
jgi:hypothetical protein